MNFLEKIDEIHNHNVNEINTRSKNKKENVVINEVKRKKFISYITIKPNNTKVKCEFLIQKQEKSKLLLVNREQRVYISDLGIIRTIVDMEENLYKWFLNKFINLYNDNDDIEKMDFHINNESFEGYGIEYYPQEYEINLFSDTKIDINDFIFILNFIFSKDIISSELRVKKDNRKINNFKKTLCKYISLIDYYRTKKDKGFLKNIGYPVGEEYLICNEGIINNDKIIDSNKINKKFNNENLIEKFDILKYM